MNGLVVLAAGIELVLAHAHDHRSGVAGVLVLAGPMLYLLSQAIYFRVETGTDWLPRLFGAAFLGVVTVPACWLPGHIVVALLVVILLLALVIHLPRGTTDAPVTAAGSGRRIATATCLRSCSPLAGAER